jgi:hypothetical protein
MNDAGSDVQGSVALTSAELQKALSGVAIPALRSGIAKLLADLGDPGQEPASVKKEYAQARTQSMADFDAAQKSSEAGIRQELLQSGGRFSPQATAEAVGSSARLIDRSRSQSLSALDFSEANQGMQQTDFLLSALGGAGRSAASGALGFGANASGAGGIMSQISQRNAAQGSTYGALAGTLIGALFGGYGAPIGAALGGVAGGIYGGGA